MQSFQSGHRPPEALVSHGRLVGKPDYAQLHKMIADLLVSPPGRRRGWRGSLPASEPAHNGFGSKLIAMGLSGAREVKETYTDQYYEAWFRAPLARMRED